MKLLYVSYIYCIVPTFMAITFFAIVSSTVTTFLHAEFLYSRRYWISSNSQTDLLQLPWDARLRKNKISPMIGCKTKTGNNYS